LRTCWLLLLEEYGVTFEYLPGKKRKNVCTVADALSRLDIDSQKMQEDTEEVLTLLSGSENSSISGSRQPSLRFQVLPTVCYLQGWMQGPSELDQVGDGLPID
jgi:hypothetical protein